LTSQAVNLMILSMSQQQMYPPIPRDWKQSESRYSRYQGEWRSAMLASFADPSVDGKVSVEPERVIAGQEVCYTVEYEVGKDEIESGGHIIFATPHWVRRKNGVDLEYCAHKSNTVAYFKIDSKQPIEAELYISLTDFQRTVYDVLIIRGMLTKGDRVRVVVGDKERGGGVYVQPDAKKAPIHVLVDTDGRARYRRAESIPAAEVVGGPAVRLRVLLRASVKPGEVVTGRVLALDRFGNPDASFRSEVSLSCTDAKAMIPDKVSFDSSNRGIVTFDAQLSSEGVHTVSAVDEANALMARSNPVDVKPDNRFSLYFGGIHAHSELSDGRGNTDEYYTYARDVQGLDFASFTDHCEPWLVYLTPPGTQAGKVIDATERYYEPGKFATVLAYEWESGDRHGHKNVYFRHNKKDTQFLGYHSPETSDPGKMFEYYRDKEAIVIPHHVKFNGRTDWSFRDDEVQRLVEICSLWGNGEKGGPYCVQSVLAKGHRLGIICGTDNHAAQPGNGFICAVYSEQLTREAVFDALRARRCYGTTGVRMIIGFEINGHLMGEEFSMPKDDARVIRARAVGTTVIEKVEIIRNNMEVFEKTGGELSTEFEFEDNEPLDSVLVEDTEARPPFSFYYLRVTQRDGNLGWSSPIWITK